MKRVAGSKKFTISLDENSVETIDDYFRASGIARAAVIRAIVDRFARRLRQGPRNRTLNAAVEDIIGRAPPDERIISHK